MPPAVAPTPIRPLTVELDPANRTRRYIVDRNVIRQTGFLDRAGLERKMQSVLRALQTGTADALNEQLFGGEQLKVGQDLFRLLFDGPEDWEPVLRHVWSLEPGTKPRPPRAGLRLRIREKLVEAAPPITDHLPWRMTAFEETVLSLSQAPWTFEVSPHPEPPEPLQLKVPAKTLVIAPEAAAGTLREARDAHLPRLLGIFERAGLGAEDFTIARTRREIEDGVRFFRPAVVYYFGHGEERDEQVTLRIDAEGGPSFLSLAGLTRLLTSGDGAPPKVVYLNGCKTATGTAQGPARAVLPTVPMVIAQSTTAWSEYMTRQAEAWFEAVYRYERCPLQQAHRLDAKQTQRAFEWGTTVVSTHVGPISAQRVRPAPADFGHRLDRQPQRDAAASEARKLVLAEDHGALRCTVLIGFGSTTDGPSYLGQQLLDELREVYAGQIIIGDPDDGREGDDRRLHHFVPSSDPTINEARLREVLEGPDHAPLSTLLSTAVPRLGARKRLLWLDFGAFGDGQTRGMLDEDQIHGWWALMASTIAQLCPHDLHVMASMTFSREDCSGVQEFFDDELLGLPERNPDGFRAVPLPPLHYPTPFEMRSSLSLAGCDQAMTYALARLMLAEADGDYEALMRLVKEGYDTKWLPLERRLANRHGRPKRKL